MSGTHDITLVLLSIVIAVVASYTALDLAGRIQASTTRASAAAWLATAAIAMGGGIWSMHFVAMLAFSLPGMEVSYDVGLTVLSLLLAVFVTGIGFAVVTRPGHGWPVLGLSGTFMGLGIAGMHYTGMAAMHMHATLSYDTTWVAISIFIAIGAAVVALWLALRQTGFLQKIVASFFMGFAISGMHYAGMRAAVFGTHHHTVDMATGLTSFSQLGLALAISGITFFILALALIASLFDQRFAMLAENEAIALRRSEEQFRSLYRRTPLPLQSLDTHGHLTEVSDAWLHLTDQRRESVLGRSLEAFMTEQSARQWRSDWTKLLAEGKLLDTEYQLVTRSGSVIDVLTSSRVERTADGSLILGGLVDVTTRKRVEQALRQAQKMEAIGQLTGGVAHDFNNLLAVVIGSLELLSKRIGDDPKSNRMLDAATEAAKRGATLTQRMLSFARQQSLKPEPVDVTKLVQGMEELLQRSLGPQIVIETKFPADGLYALVDAHQLELALLNLVVNARDATQSVGTVTVSAGKRQIAQGQVETLPTGAYIFLSVQDTGEGMDESVLARAREPFFTTKGIAKGTGLGLSMVHGFAQQSGGALLLHSRPGEGTNAEILLPAARALPLAEAEQAVSATTNGRDPKSLTVLAVDDDALVLMNTVAILEDLGHTVIPATSGASALDTFSKEPEIDLVLTDHAMPGMSGMQLASAIRKQKASMPIIVATGYAEISGNAELKLPLLNKPFTQGQLEKAISSLRDEPA
jgi:PAS domain S-box-containing protein